MNIHDLAAEFDSARPQAGGYRLRCPAHEDRQASLMLHERDGKLLLKCHAGCETADVLSVIGRTMADLHDDDGPRATVTPIRRRLVREYAYTDLAGEVLYCKRRYEPKGFDWDRKLPAQGDRVLYALPRIAEAKAAGQPVYVVEGEKDADTLLSRGLAATTAGSADGWLPCFTRQLAGTAKVVVIGDDDSPGRASAVKIGQALTKAGLDVELTLPKAGFKDVTEQYEAGHDSLAHLRGLTGDAVAAGGGRLVRLSDVVPTPPRWAWLRRLALGALSILEGEPGVSKTTVTCDLAARWSTGAAMPDGSPNSFGGPVTVAMLTAEDSLEHTLVPRLIAAGADRAKVFAVPCGVNGGLLSLTDPEHVEGLREELRTHGVKVLVVDPIAAFLGDKTDSHKDASIRAALMPLIMLAVELDLAVLVVRHFTKGSGGKAVDRGGGSVGFIGAARAAFQVSRHPDEDGVLLLANAKNNLAPIAATLSYRLVQDEKIKAVNAEFSIARLSWTGVCDLDAQDILDAVPGESGAKEFGTVLLEAVASGPKTWKSISEILDRHGYSARTAERYRSKYLERFTEAGGNAGSKWRARPDRALPKPKLIKPPGPKPRRAAATVATEPDRCETCGGTPALYMAAPVSGYRCRTHADG